MRTAAAVLAAVLVAVAASGCGGDEDDARDRVDTYIREVNAVQQRHAVGVRNANVAIRTFARHRTPTRRDAQRLRRASTTMLELRTALSGLAVPEEARVLHARLLRLFALRHGLARELSLVADYLPGAVRASAAAASTSTVLRRELRGAKTVDAQIVAFRDYGAAVRQVRAEFGALAPPPALRPWNDAQVRRLRSSEVLAADLAAALAHGDQAAADRALARFRRAGIAVRGLAPAQKAAVQRFNARIAAAERLTTQIDRERVRLQTELD